MIVNDDYVEVTEKALAGLRKVMLDIDKICDDAYEYTGTALAAKIKQLFKDTGMYDK